MVEFPAVPNAVKENEIRFLKTFLGRRTVKNAKGIRINKCFYFKNRYELQNIDETTRRSHR